MRIKLTKVAADMRRSVLMAGYHLSATVAEKLKNGEVVEIAKASGEDMVSAGMAVEVASKAAKEKKADGD